MKNILFAFTMLLAIAACTNKPVLFAFTMLLAIAACTNKPVTAVDNNEHTDS